MNDNISAYLLTNETNKREQKKLLILDDKTKIFSTAICLSFPNFPPVNTSYEYRNNKKLFSKREEQPTEM